MVVVVRSKGKDGDCETDEISHLYGTEALRDVHSLTESHRHGKD
jgi:hypothetical protein